MTSSPVPPGLFHVAPRWGRAVSLFFVVAASAACRPSRPVPPHGPPAGQDKDAGATAEAGVPESLHVVYLPPPGAIGTSKRVELPLRRRSSECEEVLRAITSPQEPLARFGPCRPSSLAYPERPPVRGKLRASEGATTIPIITHPGACLSLLVTVAEPAGAFAIAIKDKTGAVVADETSSWRRSTLVPTGSALCTAQAEALTVHLAAGTGEGDFVLHAWDEPWVASP